jgi:hypothetical protein
MTESQYPADLELEPTGAFKAPFTKEEMLSELADSLWSWAKGLSLVIDQQLVVNLLGTLNAEEIHDFQGTLFDDGAFPWFKQRVATWPIVETTAEMYDFGMLGIARYSTRDMDSESSYTYVSAFLLDLCESRIQQEVEAFGQGYFPQMALIAAQTAAARMILEEEDDIFYVFPGQGESERLTIRDVALLAKMEERSVRNAANPKRPKFLRTVSEDGKTYVKPADARAWLKDRGRYLPVVRDQSSAARDLADTSFADTTEAWSYIVDRFRSLELTADEFGREVRESDLHEWGATGEMLHGEPVVNPHFSFDIDKARNNTLMRRYALVLQVSPDLFVHRMREAAAREELALTQQWLRRRKESVDGA